MKFSFSWLKTYLECDENVNAVLDALNDLGLEVEQVIDPTEHFSNFIKNLSIRRGIVRTEIDACFLRDVF